MLRQYHASPYQGGVNPLKVGSLASGTIFHLCALDLAGLSRQRPAPLSARRCTPWILEGFLNGTVAATAFNPRRRVWEDRVMARRSDRAVLRSLATGKRITLGVRCLLSLDEHGAAPDGQCPDLPDVARFHAGWRGAARVALTAGQAA